MRYSLLSQFQGVLVGAAIGELLGVSWANQATKTNQLTSQLSSAERPRAWHYPQQWVQYLFSPEQSGAASSSPETRWGRLAVLGTRTLAERGELDLGAWQALLQGDEKQIADLGWRGGGEMAIASLPIALFFHEDETKLYQNLQRVSQGVAPQSSSILASLLMGLAIAQALKNQFQSRQVIPQMIAALTRLETSLGHPIAEADYSAILMQQLAEVQVLLEQQASLERARSQLCQPLQSAAPPELKLPELNPIQPILAALYCCLATPNDWQLAVLRSVQMKIAPQLVATLTGALAGAANSLVGIPVEWRLVLDQTHSGVSTLQFLWQVIEREVEVTELATDLLATWSGTYDTHKFLVKRSQVPAIAAPRVIRPR